MYVEGKAEIRQGGAFLNPKAKFLRDISVALIASKAGKGAKVLDATAGTGIRGIRYYLETKAKDLTMLDMNRSAFLAARRNLSLNGAKATLLNTSIQEFANTTKERFDFIDVDPFGGITPYVYDIMKVVKDGTHLMLTATDAAVLCGAHADACIRMYGSKPMHNELCHETGIRIMINYVASVAAQFNFGVEPVVSLYYAHYMRIALRLVHGNNGAMASLGNTGYIHFCNTCGYWETEKAVIPRQRACRICRKRMPAYGRMWLGRLYESESMQSIAGMARGMALGPAETRLLGKMLEEYDTPLFYSLPSMTKRMRLASSKPSSVASRLAAQGYTVTRTQFDDNGMKTDAGISAFRAAIRYGNK